MLCAVRAGRVGSDSIITIRSPKSVEHSPVFDDNLIDTNVNGVVRLDNKGPGVLVQNRASISTVHQSSRVQMSLISACGGGAHA